MNQRGNAFFYILIAVILFAALTYTLSRIETEDGQSTSDMDQGRIQIAANSIISYAASAQNALIRLDQMGVSFDTLDFIEPWETNFNDPPTDKKFFHPDGGGLAYKPLPADATGTGGVDPEPRYYVGLFNNIEWTPTSTNDVLFAAYKITEPVCKAINKQLTGSEAIPTLTATMARVLVKSGDYHSSGNADFDAADCASCDGKPALCVTDGADFAFYSVLESR